MYWAPHKRFSLHTVILFLTLLFITINISKITYTTTHLTRTLSALIQKETGGLLTLSITDGNRVLTRSVVPEALVRGEGGKIVFVDAQGIQLDSPDVHVKVGEHRVDHVVFQNGEIAQVESEDITVYIITNNYLDHMTMLLQGGEGTP